MAVPKYLPTTTSPLATTTLLNAPHQTPYLEDPPPPSTPTTRPHPPSRFLRNQSHSPREPPCNPSRQPHPSLRNRPPCTPDTRSNVAQHREMTASLTKNGLCWMGYAVRWASLLRRGLSSDQTRQVGLVCTTSQRWWEVAIAHFTTVISATSAFWMRWFFFFLGKDVPTWYKIKHCVWGGGGELERCMAGMCTGETGKMRMREETYQR